MHTRMKLDSKQPWGVWAFVIGLNLVGVIGYFILQAKGITLQSIHAGERKTPPKQAKAGNWLTRQYTRTRTGVQAAGPCLPARLTPPSVLMPGCGALPSPSPHHALSSLDP